MCTLYIVHLYSLYGKGIIYRNDSPVGLWRRIVVTAKKYLSLFVASPLNSIFKAPPPLLPSNIAWLHLAIAFTIVLPFITKHALRWTKGIGDPSIFFFKNEIDTSFPGHM